MSPRVGRVSAGCTTAIVALLFVVFGSFAEAQDGPTSVLPKPEAPAMAEPPQTAERTSLYGRPLADVEYRGLKNLAREKMEPAIKFVEGEPYTRVMERETTAALFGLYLFRTVAVEPQLIDATKSGDPAAPVKAVITVEEQPPIGRLTLEGNTKLPNEIILKELPYKEETLFPTNAAMASEQAIKALYNREGYYAASVRVTAKELPGGRVDVTVRVNEGKRVLVNDIDWEGNDSISGFRLGFEIATNPSYPFIYNYYDDTVFQSDLKAVADFYRSRGFLKAQVSEGASVTSGDGEEIDLVIKIEEGPQFIVREVKFTGFSLFTEEQLKEPFGDLLGEEFDREDFQEAIEDVRRLYGDQGYTVVTFQDQVEYLSDGDGLAFTIKVDEGQRITVGTIEYAPDQFDLPLEETGPITQFWMGIAPPVKEEVVMRRVKMKSGEPLRTAQIEETERRLKRLKLFKSVEVEQRPTDLPSVRDIIIRTTPADTAFLFLGAGTSDEGVAFKASLSEKNLFGEADGAEIFTTLGEDEWSAGAAYLDRDFLDTDNLLMRYALYHSEYSREGYDQIEAGGTVRLTREITERLTDSVQVRLADVDIDDVDRDVEAELDDYHVAALRYARSVDYRDDEDWPMEGFFLSGDVEGGYADTGFVRFGAEFDRYTPLGRDFVWATSLEGDVMPWPDDRDDLGIGERLFLGGRGSVRGFKARGIGLKDRGDDDVALGGLTRGVFRNELRFPLGPDILKGLVFVDSGFLGEDSFEYEKARVSTGFGLRALSETVTIGVDFGFALNDEDEDDTQILQFSIDSGI